MTRAVACYLHAGEFGYEVSQSNAAYVLKSKLLLHQPTNPTAVALSAAAAESQRELHSKVLKKVQESLLLMDQSSEISRTCECNGDASCGTCQTAQLTTSSSNAVLFQRLLARQYGLSVFHGNKENSLELGTCYFKGLRAFVKVS